jgi:hypothetical protein
MDRPAKPPIDFKKLDKLVGELAEPVAWDKATIQPGEHALPGDVVITVEQAVGVKCPRCWKIHSVDCNFDNLCDRCVDAILTDHPNHESVPHIKAALEAQRKRWAVTWWQDEADVWEGAPGHRTKWIGRFSLKDVRKAIADGKFKP